jgi:hypothetical protein
MLKNSCFDEFASAHIQRLLHLLTLLTGVLRAGEYSVTPLFSCAQSLIITSLVASINHRSPLQWLFAPICTS